MAHADNRSAAEMASHTDFNSTLAIIALPSIASTRFSKCVTVQVRRQNDEG